MGMILSGHAAYVRLVLTPLYGHMPAAGWIAILRVEQSVLSTIRDQALGELVCIIHSIYEAEDLSKIGPRRRL